MSNATVSLSIVFIHGLNGHPEKSWLDETSGFYWPADFARVLDNVRAMVFGYVADFSSGGRNVMGVRQHAESLLVSLRNNRLDDSVS